MLGGLNFWVSMWTSPRPTIRAIVNLDPRAGVFALATIYALQSNFFYASYWSFGLSYPFYAILLLSLVLAPFLGMLWVYFMGWVLYFTGKWLQGKAPMSHLRAVAAWSKIPSTVSLFMWLVLLITDADMTFIHAVSGPASLFMDLIAFILGMWSLVLLIQSIREIQGFSIRKSVFNVFIASIISFVLYVFIFMFVNYIYLDI